MSTSPRKRSRATDPTPVSFLRHHDKRVNIPTRELQPKAAQYPGLLYARDLWVPAVNNHGGFGRWAFVEIGDPWDAKKAIKAVHPNTWQEKQR